MNSSLCSGWLVWTPKEGRWTFTASLSATEAMQVFRNAVAAGRIRVASLNNEPKIVSVSTGSGVPIASVNDYAPANAGSE